MALADPQSATIGGVATSMPRTDTGLFTSADGNVTLSVTHAKQKGTQYDAVTLRKDAISADPIFTTQNVRGYAQATISFKRTLIGMTAADAIALAKAIRDWATDAQIAKIAGLEA
jgi:hypothetical protein